MQTKIVIALLTGILMLPLVACKKMKHQETTIVKDCTGVYLRLNGKDFQVCNKEKLDGYPTGAKITATFRQISRCKSAEDDIICMMLHEKEGWIEVLRVDK